LDHWFWPKVIQMALKLTAVGVPLSGSNRTLIYETVFIPFRPIPAIGLPRPKV
jgi:hypothetical protein